MSYPRCVSVTLVVDDYDAAIRFYCEQTGLFTTLVNVDLGSGVRNVVLGFADVTAPLKLVLLTIQPALTHVGPRGGMYPFLSLPIGDCLSEYDRLRQAGVRFDGEPHLLPFGCQATIIDPFGNRVCLSQMY